MATLPIVLPQLGQLVGPAIVAGVAAFGAWLATKQSNLGSPIVAAIQLLDQQLASDRSVTRYQRLSEVDGLLEELLGRPEARQFVEAQGITLEQARAQAVARVDQAIGRIGPHQVETPRFTSTAQAAEWYRTNRDALQLEADRGDATAADQLRHIYSYYLGEVARINRTLFFPPGFVIGEGGFEREVPPADAPPIDTPPDTAPPGGIDVPGAGGGIVTPGGIDVTGLSTGIAGGLVAGLPGVLGVGAAGLTATGELMWRGIGRAQHQGRLECQTSTAARIVQLLGGAVAPLAIPTVLLQTGQGQELIETFGSKALDLIITGGGLEEPARPETAPANAAKLLVEKMQLGASAHLWAAAAEAAAPIKTLGLNTLGAALADFAGFQRLAFATLGQVENAAVLFPMQRYAARKYRSMLPGPVDVATAYAKKELPPGEIPEGFPPRAAFTPADPANPDASLYEVFAQQGMPDWWIRTASHHLFLDPRMSEIVRMGQYFSPAVDPSTRFPTEFATKWIDARPWVLQLAEISREEWDADWWLHFRIAVGGYAYEDIKVVRETIKRAVVRRDQTLMLDAITRMHREGFLDDSALDPLVREAWGQVRSPEGIETFRGDPIAARIRATQFRTEFEVKNDVKIIVLRAMTKDVLSEREADEALADLGMPAVRRRLEIIRAKLGLLPGVSLTLPIDGAEVAGDVDELAGVQG